MAGGLFAYMAAGAAESVGKSMADQAKELRDRAREDRIWEREAAFRAGENQADRVSRIAENQADRDARSRESALDREAQAGENQKTRDASAAEAEKTRQANADPVTMADGTAGVRMGDTVSPLKDKDGNPVKLATKATDSPADVQAAEWLIKTGVAKSPEEAWNYVKQTKEGKTTAADVEAMVEKRIANDFGDFDKSPEKVDAARTKYRAELYSLFGIDGANPTKPSSGVSPKAPAETEEPEEKRSSGRPPNMSDAAIIEKAQAAIKGGADAEAVKARLKSYGIDPNTAGL